MSPPLYLDAWSRSNAHRQLIDKLTIYVNLPWKQSSNRNMSPESVTYLSLGM